MHRCMLITIDASILQTAGTLNLAIISNPYILDVTGIHYHYMTPDSTRI